MPVKRSARRAKREKVPDISYSEWKAKYVPAPRELSAGNIKWKRQKHFSISDENVVATNPNYYLGTPYQNNCQRCVPAYEMRMRGYDVVAKPIKNLSTDDFANNHWTEAFEGAIVEGNLLGTGKNAIIERMLKWGDGARAEIYVAWEMESDGSHVFVAENRNGIVYFLDPQTGEVDVEYYFESVKYNATKFFRIDNLEVNEKYISECIEEVKR